MCLACGANPNRLLHRPSGANRYRLLHRPSSGLSKFASTAIDHQHPVVGHDLLNAHVELLIDDDVGADNVRLAHLLEKRRNFIIEQIMPVFDARRAADGADAQPFAGTSTQSDNVGSKSCTNKSLTKTKYNGLLVAYEYIHTIYCACISSLHSLRDANAQCNVNTLLGLHLQIVRVESKSTGIGFNLF